MHQMRVALFFLAAGVASVSGAPSAQSPPASAAYDLLLKGGQQTGIEPAQRVQLMILDKGSSGTHR